MHIDASQVQSQTQEADICIIGAGPAGISLAREFLGQAFTVALLESGALTPNDALQALADGPTYGAIKPSVEVNRRQFGGNANVWNIDMASGEKGLRHAMFDEIDFEVRPGMPYSGWPFARSELMPFYRRAQAVCQAGPLAYTADSWETADAPALPLEGTGLETGMFQFSPSHVFFKDYRDALFAAPNVTVYTQASAIELLLNASGEQVSSAKVSRPGGPAFLLKAKVFIVAAGAFENARLLLLSDRQQPGGLGNRFDNVGRYYHDHLQGRSGYLVPQDPQLFKRMALYDLSLRSGCSVMAYLKPTREMLEKEQLLNINCFLYPRPDARRTPAIESFNRLRQRNGQPGDPWRVLRGLDYVAQMAWLAQTGQQSTHYGLGHGGWSKLAEPEKRFVRWEVWNSIEQSPHPENRVGLSQSVDSFGCRKVAVYWHWPRADSNNTLRAQALIAREMERAGLGTLQLERTPDGLPCIEMPAGSHHMMGTTRMHRDPRLGVVDADCRVHGLPNLLMAGSSTFPTGGYANPTLTLIAMALRTADLIKQDLRVSTVADSASV